MQVWIIGKIMWCKPENCQQFPHLLGKPIHHLALCWRYSQKKEEVVEQKMWKCEVVEGCKA
jgi:hypothetical protein